MHKQRISRVASILLIVVNIFAILWTVEYCFRIIPHVGWADWGRWRGVDDDLVITWWMRFLVGWFYVPVFFVAFGSFYFARRLLKAYERGVIFDERTAGSLIFLGLFMIGVGLVDTYVYAFELTLLSAWNDDGPVMPRYWYDAGDITIALAGAGFCLVGWVTREGLRMQRENESFV